MVGCGPGTQVLFNAGGAHSFEEIENVVPTEMVAAAASEKTRPVGQKVIFE